MTPRTSNRSDHDAAVLEREFDETAERYDLMVALNPGYHEHLRSAARRVTRALPEDRPARVVDLGCGSGASTAALVATMDAGAAEQVELLGVDASDGMLAVARRKPWPAGVRFQHGLAEQLGAQADVWRVPAPLDAVFACYLFRNVGDRDTTLRAVHDLLAPGGWLVTQEYSVAGSRRSIALWTLVCWTIVIPLSLVVTRSSSLYRYLWRSVLRFDSVARFEQRLREAGFVDISVETVGGWQRGILHTFRARRPAGDG